MKKVIWVLFTFWCTRTSWCAMSPCTTDDKCTCLPSTNGEYEYQCPPNYDQVGGVIIHISERDRKLEIDCYNLEIFDVDALIPIINASTVKRGMVRFCPLPQGSLKQIFDRFLITQLTYLQVRSCDLENVVLDRRRFVGLDQLTTLSVRSSDLVHLEENVFDHLPNLENVDFRENKLRLKRNLFLNTPKLRVLDISGNGISSLPHGLFRNLKQLNQLHLWNNNLTTLHDSTFEGLDSLSSLELSKNRIRNISGDALAILKKLVNISFTQNQLGKIPRNLFSRNELLELVRLDYNPGLELAPGTFSNLPKLKEVRLSGCSLGSIPADTFTGSNNLELIRLQNNQLTKVPHNLFGNLTKLKQLDMSHNRINDLSSSLQSLKSLEVLSLHHNALEKISDTDFENLAKLKDLDLGHNNISSIHRDAFEYNDNLLSIRMPHNRYSFEGYTTSEGTPFNRILQVEYIDLSHNFITDLNDDLTINKVDLKTLDLSHNLIKSLKFVTLQTVSKDQVSIYLAHNNITTVDFRLASVLAASNANDAFSMAGVKGSNTVVHLENNPIQCDCKAYDLLKYFRDDLDPNLKVMVNIKSDNVTCAGPPDFRGIPVQQLRPKMLTCPLQMLVQSYTSCPGNCSCGWRPFDTSLVVNCGYQNLTRIPEIVLPTMSYRFNQTEIHLEGNKLSAGPKKNLEGYANVTRLFLSHNRIRNVTWVPPMIEVLAVDNNNITKLDYSVLNVLNSSRLSFLSLNDNPWKCDCAAKNLTNFIRQHPRQMDTSSVYCGNAQLLLVDLNRSDLCHEWQPVYLALVVTLLLLVSAVLAALYYRYQQDIKVWLYANNMCLWWVTEEELDKDKTFDAFISYSHKDEEFVAENLLPMLEGGPHPYKLCLHFRHFVPGEFIQNSIVNSVNDSRRTLVVLSPNFLESVWGKMEFRTAHTNAMSEGRARVIVLLYGEIDINGLDEELKAYLKTNTYVKWGDPWFWNKLRYALPHSKRHINNNQKHANLMSKIDDKFTLVPHVPSNGTSESTPPVITLDPTLLKKHPLTFIPTTAINTPPAEAGSLLVANSNS